MLTKEEQDAIRARYETATPGPWVIKPWGSAFEIHVYNELNGQLYDAPMTYGGDCAGMATQADAAFIAHAREDIPALLDALESETKRADECHDENIELALLLNKALKRADEAESDNAVSRNLLVISKGNFNLLDGKYEKLKARAEALERALNWPSCSNPECHWYTPCDTCKVDSDFCEHLCNDNGETDLDMSEACPHWQFNYERFSGEEDDK